MYHKRPANKFIYMINFAANALGVPYDDDFPLEKYRFLCMAT